MRHSRRNGLIAAVVAGGGLAVAGVSGFAYADAEAGGAAERSPGVLSGNLVQLPVHLPVNVCGNTVSVVGLLNPAAGNRCVNADSQGRRASGSGTSGSGASHASEQASGTSGGARAHGSGKDSPGVLSGNGIKLPVDLPLNVSGNAISVVGIGNPSSGNTSVNGEQPSGGKPVQPPTVAKPVTPPAPVVTPATPAKPAAPVTPEAPRHTSALAHTGADAVGYALPAGGALMLGGVLLYRRFRVN
ncbi:chaplin [Streptomyces goshikiensis]|uniref:chaplin n=1 Tax=Streptomyces goshikiensis TaxID=1942 RepID=UPI003650F4E7